MKITGGISANQILYLTNQETSYREPYNYYLGGHININLYGVQLPFSFAYSNQQSEFRQPFNQFSLNPTYKWVSARIGYASQSYTPYTMNGHIFEGASVTLSPGDNWEIGLMVGRLQRAVIADSLSSVGSAYARFGYALSLKYGSGNDFARITLFKSEDDTGSLPGILDVLPEENLVGSVTWSKQFLKMLVISGEYASSALSRDTRSPEQQSSELLAKVGGLFTPRISSSYYDAYNLAADYQAKSFTVGLRYEMVEADYRTHGAYYFNNNFYNVAANSNISFFGGRVATSISLGIQQDDPGGQKMSNTRRIVGSFNTSIAMTEQLNFELMYSNYTTFTNINRDFLDLSFLSPYDRIDTLNYSQVTQNGTISVRYLLNSDNKTSHMFTGRLNAMDTRDVQAEIAGSSLLYIVGTGMYSFSSTPTGFTASAMINLQKEVGPLVSTTIVGPTITVTKYFFDKTMQTSAALAFNTVLGASAGYTLNGRATASYRLGDSHNFMLSLISVSRNRTGETTYNASDLTGTFGYSYTF